MQDKFNAFFVKDNDKPIEVEDPSNLDQCFDLAFDWVDFLGIPREAIRHLKAFQIFAQPTVETDQYFDLIPNTPSFVPQVGDMGVFNVPYIGPSGHVCICTGVGDTNGFQSFDQNWNGLQKAVLVNHNYTSFLGVLRVKGATTAQPIAQSDYSQMQAVDDIYQGLCGTHPSDDEKKSRAEQLAKGKNIVNIVTDICNGDSRFRDLYITPAINAAINDFQKNYAPLPTDPGIAAPEIAPITAPAEIVDTQVIPILPNTTKNNIWSNFASFFKGFKLPF